MAQRAGSLGNSYREVQIRLMNVDAHYLDRLRAFLCRALDQGICRYHRWLFFDPIVGEPKRAQSGLSCFA